MQITINSFGSRGDIQPYIALGKGLTEAGHHVRVLTHKVFETFVREHRLDFYPIQLDPCPGRLPAAGIANTSFSQQYLPPASGLVPV